MPIAVTEARGIPTLFGVGFPCRLLAGMRRSVGILNPRKDLGGKLGLGRNRLYLLGQIRRELVMGDLAHLGGRSDEDHREFVH